MRDASSYPEVSGPAGEIHAFYNPVCTGNTTTGHYRVGYFGRVHGANNCNDELVSPIVFIDRCSFFNTGVPS